MPAKVVRQFRKLLQVLPRRDYRYALWRGRVAAAVEHEPLLKTLQFATIVDIGANRGQFALVSRHCFPGTRIFSFEPLAAPANCFRTVFNGDPLVTLQQIAVGPAAGRAIMHVSAEDDASSLLPATALQLSLWNTNEIGTETIQVERLASCIQEDALAPPALLKIDVQGYELAVLQGCEELLHRFSHVYVECSFVPLYEGQALADEVIEHLHQRGFELRGVYNTSYDSRGQAIQADLLFAARG
jgi:FkbM family methyltransferase